jgi:DNA invertase Pin-like site-specific DNA recombinase
MRAALYTRVSAADLGVTAVDLLAELRRYTKDVRGWQISIELADRGPGIAGRREGLALLTEKIRGRAVDVVVTTSLARLCRSLDHVIDLYDLLGEVDLVALKDMVDTTTPDGRVRWCDAAQLFRGVRQAQRSEAVRLARIKAAVRGVDDNWGRPVAAINPLELAGYWHGGPDRRPLSIREIAQRMGYGQATIRKHVAVLLDAGKLSLEERQRHLGTAGGLRKGGRPSRSRIDDEDLLVRWHAGASITSLRTTYRCAAAKIRARLDDLRRQGQLNDALRRATLEILRNRR